ncbi:MAG: hypothetical protein KIH63_004765 [Candidatus Saccharibacteria bacterium]|nr:hypothetical protein [Candidatus Saccharibacteria bacterium]
MDLPAYITNPDSEAIAQENYHQEFNQTIRQNLGPNGFSVTTITNTDLTVTPVLNPNDSSFTTVADLMPVGTIWFVTDATPPNWVGKQASGPTVLVQFTTAAYP